VEFRDQELVQDTLAFR